MRVLHVTFSLNPDLGGVVKAVTTLVTELDKAGVENAIATLDHPSSKYNLDINSRLIFLGPTKSPWKYAPRLTPWLEAKIGDFDVVIIHGLWLYYSYAALKIFQKRQKKTGKHSPRLFVMPHGMLDPYFQRARDRRLKAIRNWFFWKMVEKNVVNEADGLLFTAATEMKLAQLPFSPYNPKAEYVVGFGVENPPQFTDQMQAAFASVCPELNGRPYLLFLSRIHPKKGLDLLIDAYIHFHQKHKPNGELLPLVIAGPDRDSAYGVSLEKRIHETPGLSKNIFFAGMLHDDTKWGAFYGCEAFILPSHQENFGIAVVEALACGKPVLISDQVNIWEEIQKGGGGLVGRDTREGVRDMLKTWLEMTEDQKEEMRIQALKVYGKHFNAATLAQKYMSVFNGTQN